MIYVYIMYVCMDGYNFKPLSAMSNISMGKWANINRKITNKKQSNISCFLVFLEIQLNILEIQLNSKVQFS